MFLIRWSVCEKDDESCVVCPDESSPSLEVYKEVRFLSFCFSHIPHYSSHPHSQPSSTFIMSLFSITPVYSSDAIKAIEERVDASSSECVLLFLVSWLFICLCFSASFIG